MSLETLISDLETIEKCDVMMESINLKLTKSLLLYLETLEKSYDEILETECLKVVTKLVNKYTKKVEDTNG